MNDKDLQKFVQSIRKHIMGPLNERAQYDKDAAKLIDVFEDLIAEIVEGEKGRRS